MAPRVITSSNVNRAAAIRQGVSQAIQEPDRSVEAARWYGSGGSSWMDAPTAEARRWYGGQQDWRQFPQNVMGVDEDYSADGAYRRAFDEVAYQSSQDYYADYPVTDPNAPVNPREISGILRYRRANANKLLLSRIPDTLERYPSLAAALANTEIDENDARRLINLAELDSAYNAITSTSDPIRQRNIILTMNPVQRAAFFDFFTAKVEELNREAAQNPSWAESTWNEFYGKVVEPIFNGLIFLNEKSQQTFRAGIMALSEAREDGMANVIPYALPGVGNVNMIRGITEYWDQVAPGVYDQEYLDGLRGEFGAARVDAFLRLEELKRDGEPDPYGRWIAENVGTENEDLVRSVTWRKYEDPELLRLAKLMNTADQGNTGMLVLSDFPEEWRDSDLYDTAAGALNVVATFALDPTLVGAKFVGTYRAARYSLIKLSSAGGIDEAFKMRRTRVFFDALGRDFDRLENLDAAKRAVARDVIRRQYGGVLPANVIDDMAESGVRNADDANAWFVSKMVAESMLMGVPGVGQKFATTFDQIAAATYAAKRRPLLPGKTTAGVLRSRFRLLAAIHNPVNRRFAERFNQRFGDIAADGVDASAFGSRLSDEAESIGAEAGAVQRRGPLGDFARAAAKSEPAVAGDKPSWVNRAGAALGYRYADKSISARMDRIQRRFAKAPIPSAVYMNDGRDAGAIYDWARVFLTRQDAAIIADIWRGAPNQAVRKQIFNGLVKTHAAAKGVMLRDPSKSWRDFLPEVSRGGVYAPTLRMKRREDGIYVWDRSEEIAAVKTFDDDIAAFASTGEDLYHGTNRNFDAFDEEVAAARGSRALPRTGGGRNFYFSEDEQVAGTFSREAGDSMVLPEYDSLAWSDFVWQKGNGDPQAAIAQVFEEARANGRPIYALLDETVDGRIISRQSTDPDEILDYMSWTGDSPLLFPEGQAPRVIKATVYGKSLNLRIPREAYESDASFQRWIDENVPEDLQEALRVERVGTSNAFDAIFNRFNPSGYYHESSSALVRWARDNGYGKILVNDAAQSGGKSVIAVPEFIAYGKNDPVAALRLRLQQQSSESAISTVDDIIEMRPSNFGGQEYPLHKWQAADYVKIPNFVDIERAGVKATFVGALFGTTQGQVAQRIVDLWSLANLAGPRYYLRNSIEDFAFYAMTDGVWRNVYKGRRFGTALRRVRGTKLGLVNRALQGKAKAIPESTPARTLKTTSVEEVNGVSVVTTGTTTVSRVVADDPDFSAKWQLIKSRFTKEDRAAAFQAMQDGDLSKVRDLVGLAMARAKLTGWSKANQDDLLDFVTDHGAKLLDEANETTTYGVSGLLPQSNTRTYAVVADPTDGATGVKLVYPTREWGDVSPNGNNPIRFTSWLRDLRGVADTDGALGQAALGGILRGESDEVLIPRLAQLIRDDEQVRWMDRIGAFQTAEGTPEVFASRYLMDVRNMVSLPDGKPNRQLLGMMQDADSGFFSTAQVTVDDLIGIPSSQRPERILGQTATEVPMPTSIKGFDKLWEIMGEQYARLAREPIFLANYLEQRTFLRPYEQQMAKQFGTKVARAKAAKMATDRAYGLMLSYTDNPLNRTLLAWNVRNVARYYRATEDFARRALRVAKNYPQGFWKVGLTYDVLEDTGFVFTDENDEKYFVFPGSEPVINTVNWALQRLPAFQGNSVLQMDAASYEMRGYVRMLSPSADPYQWIPTLSSPLAAVGVKSILAAFPALESFEQAVLGEYGENSDFWRAVMPGHVNRIWGSLDRDERLSMYSSVFKDAVQVSAASGAMPAYDAPQEEWDKYATGLDTLVTTVLVLRAAGGFFMPAPPRLTSRDVTDFAREGGILNMDAAFREMIRTAQEDGSQNPFADGLVKYVETFGIDAVPYSISTSESNERFGSLDGLSSVAANEEGEKWVREHDDLVTGRHKTAAAWLMPRIGKYSADQNRWLRNAGYKIPSSYSDVFEKARIAEGRYVMLTNREQFETDLSAARANYYQAVLAGNQDNIDAAWDAVRTVEKNWEVAQKLIKTDYKGLEAFGTTTETIELNNESRKRLLDNEIRPMLQYIFEDRDREVPPGAQNMADAIATFDAYATEVAKIQGSTNAEDLTKRMLRIEAEQMLGEIGARDPNTQFFVDVILIPIFSRTYLPPGASQ